MRECLLFRAPAPSLLVRFPNWIGDAVLALPALAALRRSLPSGTVSVLAKPWVADIVVLSPDADGLVPFPSGAGRIEAGFSLVRSLRARRFDGAVLLQNAFEAALLVWGARVPLRGGYSTDLRGLLLTHPVRRSPAERVRGGAVRRTPGEGGHQVHYYLDLARSLGFSAEVDPVPRLSPRPWVPPLPGRRWAALAPGAAYGPAKAWPAERFGELGKLLSARGLRLVVLGSPGESPTCRGVAEMIGPSAFDLSGRTTLGEAASVLSSCELAVTNDSGLMHLAAAVGTPLVALFGSTDPGATGPVSHRAVVVRGNAPCAPCFRRRCPALLECFLDITVDRVEEACDRALAMGREPS